MQDIKLGYTYKDKITGFYGIVVGYVQYISGCNQALVQPECDSSGILRDSAWFDVQRLEEQVMVRDPIVLDNGVTPGCDKMAPKR